MSDPKTELERQGVACLDCIGNPPNWNLAKAFSFPGGLQLSSQILGAVGAIVECQPELSIEIQVTLRGEPSVASGFLKRVASAVRDLKDGPVSCDSPVFISDVENVGITALVSLADTHFASNQQAETVVDAAAETSQGEELSPEQRRAQMILAAMDRLLVEDYQLAEQLLAELVGAPMTKELSNSISDLLRHKGWRVVCETCGKPSTLTWRKAQKAGHSGRAQFSHTGPDGKTIRHKSISSVRKLKFCVH